MNLRFQELPLMVSVVANEYGTSDDQTAALLSFFGMGSTNWSTKSSSASRWLALLVLRSGVVSAFCAAVLQRTSIPSLRMPSTMSAMYEEIVQTLQ